ncbi:MAG: DMT family transporter [Candidatus Marsarchaeota archaeon]|nr:DMT family transporter [Candidatus Marsarchaeota archaeon]
MIEPIAIAIFAALSWSISGTLIKSFASRYGSMLTSFVIAAGNLLLIGMVLLFLGHFSISTYSIALSILGGVFTAIGYLFFYVSLKREQASNAFATIEIQVVLIALYGILALHESVALAQGFGMVLVVLGILMVSFEKGHKFNKGLLPAMLANVFWAFGWIALVYPIAHSSTSLLPVWISFVADIVLVSAVMLANTRRMGNMAKINARGAAIGLSAGLASGIGNSLYSFLVSMRQLVIGTVLSNTSPAIVGVFAHFAYHDRLTKLQIAGLAVVVTGGMILGA